MVVEEFDADLSDTTSGTRATDDLGDLGELDWLILYGVTSVSGFCVRGWAFEREIAAVVRLLNVPFWWGRWERERKVRGLVEESAE